MSAIDQHEDIMDPSHVTGPLHLGQKSELPKSPDEAIIDCVTNPHQDTPYVARFMCPEFTSLCPVTGQPDYAAFIIDYIPSLSLVESKALKLFLGSFRNHGAFHEDCTVMIGKRLFDACRPHWMRVTAYWNFRGGIAIDVLWQQGRVPPGTGILPDNTRNALRTTP